MAVKKLNRKIALVTGANAGMGYQTALALASRNYKVIMADKDDQTESRQKIIEKTCNEDIVSKYLDLTSFKSVRDFAKKIGNEEQHLNVLINNAGVFCMKNQKTCDGFDAVIQVNHLAPFLLTNLLTESLKVSGEGRIIFITSSGAFFHNITLEHLLEPKRFFPNIMSTAVNYYNSKLCNMISSKFFAARLKKLNITSNCLHPGMTNTSFLVKIAENDDCFEKVMKQITSCALRYSTNDASTSARLAVFLATAKSIQGISGEYFVNYQIHKQPNILEDMEFCKRIWEESRRLVGIENEEKLAV